MFSVLLLGCTGAAVLAVLVSLPRTQYGPGDFFVSLASTGPFYLFLFGAILGAAAGSFRGLWAQEETDRRQFLRLIGINALVAETLVHAGPGVARAIPDQTHADLVDALSQGMSAAMPGSRHKDLNDPT